MSGDLKEEAHAGNKSTYIYMFKIYFNKCTLNFLMYHYP